MSTTSENPFPIVGIGASAGGLTALKRLIDALPPRPGLALVVIQHLDPHHESQLGHLLQPHTAMKVVDAVHNIKVRPDHVYVIKPNTDVAIADGALSVTARKDGQRPNYPVDHFLRSLAGVQGQHAIGVILSGTGSDGMLGICEIKAAGGVTFAQDDSAQHTGMPQRAIDSGAIDLVLPPEEIAARLVALPDHPYLKIPAGQEREEDLAPFQRIVGALRNMTGVDFSQYRDSTIKRRVARRMLLRGFTSPVDYAKFLERDRGESDALYRDVLINVTSFFRDPEMFEDLKREVFPEILKQKSDDRSIRVWVPGCSTGQEAYSLAIALTESLDTAGRVRHSDTFQIFATDLGDPGMLDRARAGVYPESIEAEVSPARLARFFTKEERTYRINKSIRDRCVFARQNITVDPPFSRVDLVTCRNVLIYMSPPLQERLLPVFHFALNPGGFLVLGLAETAGKSGDLFDLVNTKHKIYRKKESAHRPLLTFISDDWVTGLPAKTTLPAAASAGDLQREIDRMLLWRYAPPSVVVDKNFEILQFRGRTAPYLEVPAGQPTTNILRMASPGLFMDLRSAMAEAQAAAAGAPIVREGLHVSDAGADIEFTLRVLPVHLPSKADGCLLVIFEPKGWPVWSLRTNELPELAVGDVAWLRQELASSQAYLQSVVDRQDASAQELRAAHEEVLSSNEELQSTNEELETAKEELQSANEELTTVNEQYQSRNRELDALTDDLSNFISSANLPLVTVDRELRIRRLTPAAERTFNLMPADIGRSIEHIKFSLAIDGIGAVIETVIASQQSWERELRDHLERWWVLRVLPFHTADDRVDGATLVAIDIDVLKRSHDLIEARDYAIAIVQTVREPLVVLDAEGHVELANEAFRMIFGDDGEPMEGRLLWETGSRIWRDAFVRDAIVAAAEGREPITGMEITRALPSRGLRTLLLNARSIVRAGRPTLLLLAVDDITEARQAETLRIDAETLRLVNQRKDEFLGILAHELRNPLAPMRFSLEILQRAESSGLDHTWAKTVLDRQVSHLGRIVDDLLDVSRITQGKVELRKETVELAPLVTSAVELCQSAIDAAHHAVTVSLPDEPIFLEADAVRLTQVLVNLLNNAIKFTPAAGHIWVIAERTGESPGRLDQLRIRVRDTGIGISAATLPHVFDMFMQGDRTLERTRGGLGVGLTLVRSLVALHSGSVDVRSNGPGTGTEFIISLPIDPAKQQDRPGGGRTHGSQPSDALKIVVADDNVDGREMLSFLLKSDGHDVTMAEDGQRALAAVLEMRPEVAILDIGMPILSGYMVAERVREELGAGAPFLIALSGLGHAEDKARAATAGFDQHFTKPVDLDVLTGLLSKIPKR